MTKIRSHLSWCCQGASVLGASHQKSGLPNQDAIFWWPAAGTGSELILAVADGHGSAQSFRSDRGSRYAVQVAVTEIRDFFSLPDVPPSSRRSLTHWLPRTQRIAQELPRRIVAAWRDRVDQDLQKHPFTDREWATLAAKAGADAGQTVQQWPRLAYGATLLAALVTDTFILYLQLGDGDILCVDAQGQTKRPLVKDPRLIANETTSLCAEQAWEDLQVRLVPLADDWPSLILLSTDGYANAFASEGDFLKIGPDYQHMIQTQGLNAVLEQLPAILQDASRSGSGDDITLGILNRNDPGQGIPVDNNQDDKPDPEEVSYLQSRVRELLLTSRKQQGLIRLLQLGLVLTLILALVALGLASYPFFPFHAPPNSQSPTPSPSPSQQPTVSELQLELLLDNGQQILLKPGMILYAHNEQISDQAGSDHQQPIAAVIGEIKPGQLTLFNLSDKNWRINQTNSQPQDNQPTNPEITRNESIALTDGLVIDFDGATGRVTAPSNQNRSFNHPAHPDRPEAPGDNGGFRIPFL